MALRMTSLERLNSGSWLARKAIPQDVRAEYKRLYGQSREAQFRRPSTTLPAEAKSDFSEWLSEIETRIENIRSNKRGDPQNLTAKEARALSGIWYEWFVKLYEDNPGTPETWEFAFDLLIDELRRIEPEFEEDRSTVDLDDWLRHADVREELAPLVAAHARIPSFLASKGLALTPKAQNLFLGFVAHDYVQAVWLLKRRAEGDYSPDDHPQQFPQFFRDVSGKSKKASLPARPPLELFEKWIELVKPAPGTVSGWRPRFETLAKRFPDANLITDDEAHTWIRSLITKERSAKTAHSWLTTFKTVFKLALEERLIATNPFANIKLTVPRRAVQLRDKAFTAKEANLILRAALAVEKDEKLAEAKRWVPWLQAYSGARGQEITQLRGQDVRSHAGVWAMNLTPEAGTIKTNTARLVPIHEHLIDQGFLDFVKSRGQGPLFYNPPKKKPKQNQTPPAEMIRGTISKWVRDLGIDDPSVSPTHSWRHTFKQIANRCGISERDSDAITGHAPRTAGAAYGRSTVGDMAEALKKFPRYLI